MIIDDDSFVDFALHLRRASEHLLSAADRLSGVCREETAEGGGDEISVVVDSLTAMNKEFALLETILRTVWESNRELTLPLA